MKVPFTGTSGHGLMVTTDKIRTKQFLKKHRIPTPGWIVPGSKEIPDPGKKYILKPVWEDGSAGITDASVMEGRDIDLPTLSTIMKSSDLFLEEFIEGREFNITLLSSPGGPEVMPAAEMRYVDYPDGKPKILNWASKWEPGSFEYGKTIRSFQLDPEDRELVSGMNRISLQCWVLLGLRGYARVDFRVDEQKRPFVLEVNANPCISPDAGFVAACAEGGVPYRTMIDRILNDI
jgi:D-alanine-D-alanine ligase